MPLKPLPIARRPISPILLLLVPILALGLYLRALDQPLMRPGRVITELNGPVTGQMAWSAIWTEPTAAHPASLEDYRPVLLTMLWVEWRMWGNSPSSFHAFSILLFLSTIVLYLFLVSRLIQNTGARFAAGLILALHPMASQSILGVEGQAILLALLATLAGGLELLRWRRTGNKILRTSVLLTLAFAVAIGSHPMGPIFPLWILALAWLGPGLEAAEETPFRARSQKLRAKQGKESKDLKEPPPRQTATSSWKILDIALPMLGVAAGYLALRHAALDKMFSPSFPGVSLQSSPSIFLYYLIRLIWPVSPTLVYTSASLPGSVFGWLALFILIAVTAAAARRWPTLSLGLIFLLTPVIAISHVLPLNLYMSESPLLFALPGLGLVIAALIEKAAGLEPVFPMIGWRSRALAAVIIIAAASMAWQTNARARAWSSEQALWEHETALHPQAAQPEIELMGTLLRQAEREATLESGKRARALATDAGDIDRIIEYEARLYVAEKDTEALRKLLEQELDSDRATRSQHLAELGATAQASDMPELAEEFWRKQLKIDPNSFTANYNLEELEFRRKNNEAALEFGARAAQHAPKNQRDQAYAQYAEVLMDSGHYEEAAIQFEQVLKLNPSLYVPYLRLIQIHWGRKDYVQAEQVMSAAFSNANVSSYVDLATMYVSMMNERGRLKEAMGWLMQIIQRYPSDAQLRLLAAETYLQQHEYTQARQLFQSLRDARPDVQADAMVGAGQLALEADKDLATAEKLWRQALKLNPQHKNARALLLQNGLNPDAAPEIPAQKP